MPKGADVGSGREGWLAIDDWTNGRWQEADAIVAVDGDLLRFTFRPLDAREFPEEGFSGTFRRTIKLRAQFGAEDAGLIQVRAITDF